VPDEPVTEQAHARWFRSVEQEIAAEYRRLHTEAVQDPQRAGHGGEQTWARILTAWLPASYTVVTRKYIIPEVGTDAFETDLVVLHPSYPTPLQAREEILVGGVAAAFSVKLTLDAAGLQDGVQRAVSLRRGLAQRHGTARDEMLAPFPVGLLAHSHTWKAPGSAPGDNINEALMRLDAGLVQHPRESLDYLCVADLGFWWTVRIPYMPSIPTQMLGPVAPTPPGRAMTGISQLRPGEAHAPVAALIANLLARLSYSDPTLNPLATSLRALGALGTSEGKVREWALDQVFTELVRVNLTQDLFRYGSELMGSAYF
jgi:hypothetical protein